MKLSCKLPEDDNNAETCRRNNIHIVELCICLCYRILMYHIARKEQCKNKIWRNGSVHS